MSGSKPAAMRLAALSCLLTLATASSPALGDPASRGPELVRAEHGRVVAHWTPERRAAAAPRDLVLDPRGQAYLRRPDGTLEPYGRGGVESGGGATPNAKPGGGGGDTTFPAVSGMNPADGQTIGASHTFSAKVTDAGGLRSVSFSIQKSGGRAQSFAASSAGSDVWTASLSGFTDGPWSWWVVARDTAGNTTTTAPVSFTVSTSGGGSGGGGSGDTVTNADWDKGNPVQTAVGRIFFEMPSNSRRTRWAGYVCSGTVTQDGTSGRSVILTAAHCVYDDANKAFARNVLFIPNQDATTGTGTDRDCSNDPLGCWTPTFGVVDVNWTTRTFPDNIPWDYAAYVVPDVGAHSGNGSGGALDGAVSSLPVSFVEPFFDDGTVGATSSDFTYAIGYSYSDDPNLMYCAEDMTTEGTANWWLPSCGLSGGSSGGLWDQDGSIVSVNSWGYTTSPGMAGPKLNGTSASCVYSEAKTVPFGTVPTTAGDAGVKAACPQ